MERAPLRPVPSRPPSRVDPAEAIRHVRAELSPLDAPAAEALALIALAGRSREDVAGQAGMSDEQLAEALARARKQLRRRLHPLPGSGWCERAERLISDRFDDALEDPGPARLEVHLANCPRCVEHERRLAQAQDALVAGFAEPTAPPPEAQPQPQPQRPPQPQGAEPETSEEPVPAPPAALRIVERRRVAGPAPSPEARPDESAATVKPPKAPVHPPEPLVQPPEPPVHPPELGADDAPAALPPAEDAPALPEPDRPPALYGPQEPALPEREEPALAEAQEPQEPPALPAEPETAPRPAPDRLDPLSRTRPYVPVPGPTRLPRQAAAPSEARARLAATYAPASTLDGSRYPESDETWAAVGPLLALFMLAIFLLVFSVLTVGL